MSANNAHGHFVLLTEDGRKVCKESDRELRNRIFKVALPVYPSGMVGQMVGLFSTALIGQLGDRSALAAVGLSCVMTNILGYSWLWGLSGAISTLSSQDWGAGSYEAIGITLQRSVLVLTIFADLPLIIAWLNSERLMELAGQPPDVAAYVGLYTSIRIPGIVCETISVSLNRTLSSIGNTRISAMVSMVVTVANAILSFVLVPRYGFVGAPLTATFCDIFGVIMTCAFAFRDADFRKCWTGLDKRACEEWLPFLKISLPSFVMLASEAWCWNLQDFLCGFISEVAMATNAIAPILTGMLYVTGSALSVGSSTVIGNLLGEGSALEARRAAILSMQLLEIVLIPQAVALFFVKSQIPYLFTQDLEVVGTIEQLLPLTMAFSFLDTHQAVLTGIICAAGQQSVAAPLIAVAYWLIGVPLGIGLAFGFVTDQPHGLWGLWIGMFVGVLCHALSFAVVVLRIDWDKVAEQVQERTREEHQIAPVPTPLLMTPLQPLALVRATSAGSAVSTLSTPFSRSKSEDLAALCPGAPPPLARWRSAT